MFVRDFIHVDQPFELVAPRFVADAAWLVPIAEEAASVARELAVSLGDATARRVPRGSVRCEIGPVRARARSLLVPLWLVHQGAGDTLPDLAGDLEVAPVGSSRSLLALGATYERPTREPEVVHRVERATEAGVRTFLSGIATVLSAPAAPTIRRG